MFIRTLFLTAVILGVFAFHASVYAAAPGDVVINELMWMGSSLNSSDEWIELRNMTAAPVDISGWTLFKKSGGNTVPMLVIPSGKVISASGFFLIANYAETDSKSALAVTPDVVDTDVSLVNSALQVTLADSQSTVIDVADDGTGTPLAGKYTSNAAWQSMERNVVPGDGQLKESWHTASTAAGLKSGPELGTPKAANSNQPPVIRGLADQTTTVGEAVTFDVTESSDPDGDPFTFAWDFGDGESGTGATPVHTYARAGTFSVIVIASDGQVPIKATAVVTVQPTTAASLPIKPAAPSKEPSRSAPPSAPSPTSPPTQEKTAVGSPGKGLRFSELLPDPTGQDAGAEFIEFVNTSQKDLFTEGWQVTDGKKKTTLPNATLEPDERLVIRAPALSFVLRNAGATLYLLDPSGAIRDGVRYPKAKTGKSFSRVGVRWLWAAPTPLEENEKPKASVAAGKSTPAKAEDPPTVTTVDGARRADAHELVQITGVVTIPTGILDERQLLLGDDTGTVVVVLNQPTSYSVGQRLQVTGKKSTAKEPRLRVAVKDVRVVGQGDPADASTISVEALSEDDLAAPVSMIGTVTVVRATSFTLDDETGTISVGGPKARNAEKGSRVRVTGVIRETSGRFRLVAASVETLAATPTPTVAGASVEQVPAGTQPLPTESARTPILAYAFIGVAGALLVARQTLVAKLAD